SARTMYARIEKGWKDPSRRADLFHGHIRNYLDRFGAEDTDRTRHARQWADEAGGRQTEPELRRTLDIRRPNTMDEFQPAEKEGREAGGGEESGKLEEAAQRWKNLEPNAQERSTIRYWALLARKRAEQFEQVKEQARRLEDHRKQLYSEPNERKLDHPLQE